MQMSKVRLSHCAHLAYIERGMACGHPEKRYVYDSLQLQRSERLAIAAQCTALQWRLSGHVRAECMAGKYARDGISQSECCAWHGRQRQRRLCMLLAGTAVTGRPHRSYWTRRPDRCDGRLWCNRPYRPDRPDWRDWPYGCDGRIRRDRPYWSDRSDRRDWPYGRDGRLWPCWSCRP